MSPHALALSALLVAELTVGAKAAGAQAAECTPHLLGADRRGLAWSVERSGDIVFVASGGALLVIDVSDRKQPREMAAVQLDDAVFGLALDGDVAAVLGHRSLSFVDVSVPSRPEVGETIPLPFAHVYQRNLAAAGGFTYYVDGPSGLRIFDSRDPTAVVEVGSLPGLSAASLALGPTRAYLQAYEGVTIVDLGDPARPVVTGQLPGVGGQPGISESGKVLALSSNPCGPRHCCTRVRFFELTDPDHPFERGVWWSPSDESCGSGAPVLRDGRAYVLTQPGFYVLDVTDLDDPVELAEIPFDGWGYDAVASPTTFYVANVYSSLRIFAVEDPPNAEETAELPTPGESFAALLDGSLAVVEHRHGLRALDLSDPARPLHLGEARFADEAFSSDLAAYGSYVYAIGDRKGARPFDFSDPSHPLALDAFAYTSARALQRAGSRLYLQRYGSAGRLEIWDLDDPEIPAFLAAVGTGEGLGGFSIAGPRLFTRKYGLDAYFIYDVLDPADVHEIGGRLGVEGFDLSVARPPLLVYASSEGLSVDDVTHSIAPRHLGGLALDDWPNRIAAYGSRAYVPRGRLEQDDARGVLVVDLSDPADPAILADLVTPGTPHDVAVGPGLLVVADGDAGISIFDTCQPFADGFESGDTSGWSAVTP